jgi:chemotaxis protein MotB
MRLHQRLRRDQGRHADDWLITYADTITLLLCLFVVILSIKTADRTVRPNLPPAPPFEDIFGHPIFHPFARVVDPVTDELQHVRDAAEPDTETLRHGQMAVAEVPAEPVRAILLMTPPAPRHEETAANSLPAIVDRLKSEGRVLVQQGDRITTLQISSATFFASGYAALSGPGKSILRDVAVTLKSADFARYHISIEGHTDDMPINTAQFQSNWELSTARAAAVVRFFLEEGIPARKLSAAGYADTFPVARNRNDDGTVNPENQATNRRVVIKLEEIKPSDR